MAENMRQNGSVPSPGVCGGLTGPGTVTPLEAAVAGFDDEDLASERI